MDKASNLLGLFLSVDTRRPSRDKGSSLLGFYVSDNSRSGWKGFLNTRILADLVSLSATILNQPGQGM
jgi:hypothetical protein